MRRTLLTASLFGALAGVAPAVAFQLACGSESEARAAYFAVVTAVLVCGGPAAVVVLTAHLRALPNPLRQPAWLTFLAGPLLTGTLAFAVAWVVITGRPWADEQAGRAAAVVFGFATMAVFALAARRRTGRWQRGALLWMAVGVCCWVATFWSRQSDDGLAGNLPQDLALFPIWMIAFAPPWLAWTASPSPRH
jgi:hypothetical protein